MDVKPLFFIGDYKCHRLSRYFTASGGDIVNMDDYNLIIKKTQLPVVRGLWDTHIDRIRFLEYYKIPFVYCDNAYFLRSHPDQYYRVSLNQLQESVLVDRPGDRWHMFQTLGAKVEDWRDNKRGPIVICPPTPQPMKMYTLDNWTSTTFERVKQLCPGREIIIRDKPRGKHLTESFKEVIERAYCVVTFNSIAAVESAMYGVPVVVDRTSAAASVGVTSLEDINSLVRPDRTRWLNMLSYSQFSVHEIMFGLAWKEMLYRLKSDIQLPPPDKEVKQPQIFQVVTPNEDRFSLIGSINKLKHDGYKVMDYGSGNVMLQEKLDIPVTRYDPAIKGIDKYPTEAVDIVVCSDVLQFNKESVIDTILDSLHSLCNRYAIFVIDTRVSNYLLPDGRNAHLTVKPAEWWVNKLQRRFELVAIKPIKNVEGAKIKMVMKKRKALNDQQNCNRVG